MERFSLFTKLMDAFFEFADISYKNQRTPRTYGTEDVLFMGEVHLIRTIAENPNVTVTELARIRNTSGSAMSQMVNKLSKKGLINREKIDNKQMAISLSQKGEHVFHFHDKLDNEEYSHLLKYLENVSNDDIEKMIFVIKLITEGSINAIEAKKRLNESGLLPQKNKGFK